MVKTLKKVLFLSLVMILLISNIAFATQNRDEIAKMYKDSYKKISKDHDLKIYKDKDGTWYDTVVVMTTIPQSKFEGGLNHGKTYDMDNGEAKGVLTLIATDVVKADGINLTLYYYKGRLYKYKGTGKTPSMTLKQR